jgi:hypothetical protein
MTLLLINVFENRDLYLILGNYIDYYFSIEDMSNLAIDVS